MPKRIFISYCHIEPDRTVARQIAAAIKEHHDVFIDQDIRPGGEWGEDIENALQTADFVVVFLSEVATQSPMVIAEIETAHQRRLKTGQPTLIPVRLGFDRLLRYPLSAYVNRFQHIVWRGTNDTEGLISELLSTVTADTATQGHFQPANSERAHKKSFWLKRTADDTLFRRNRHQMIKRVKHDWIDGVLEQSLFQVARIALGFIEKPEAIEQPIHAVLQRSYDEPRPLPPGIGVSTIFDEQLGQLLILGAPGSGKTTVLLELAEELLKRASKDESHPIPVVFNLASWAVHRRSLAAWIVDELNDSYDVPRRLGRQW
jgi:hypothetical protein